MTVEAGPDIITSGLILHLDAANFKSYPGSGTVWTDLSLSKNNISLSNGVGYSSSQNGAMVFDGIDDFSNPSIGHSYLSSSALEIVFNSSSHGTGFKTLFGYRHNSGYSFPTIGSIYLNGNTLSASVITLSEAYRTTTFSSPISTNITYHVVLNKDTVNGTLQLFVNSVAGTAQTFDASTYGQWFSAGNFIGSNNLDIAKSTNNVSGQGWGADFFSGKIHKLSVYNKILTQTEISDNFNAVRGRYGI